MTIEKRLNTGGLSTDRRLIYRISREYRISEQIVCHIGQTPGSERPRVASTRRTWPRSHMVAEGRVTWSPVPAAQILIEVSPWRKIPPNGNKMSATSRKMARCVTSEHAFHTHFAARSRKKIEARWLLHGCRNCREIIRMLSRFVIVRRIRYLINSLILQFLFYVWELIEKFIVKLRQT